MSRSFAFRAASRFLIYFVLITVTCLAGCGSGEDIRDDARWDVVVEVSEDSLLIFATIADVHGDFIHMSIRRDGYENGYTIERSPAPNQPERDWSRVHHWFKELHPNTYLEGRIDDGSGRGPRSFQTYAFEIPRGVDSSRDNYPDIHGSDYEYITRGYSYADGNSKHPTFDAGDYEVEIYAWYTGRANSNHPSTDGSEGVQYVHYEKPMVSTHFIIED